MLTQGPKSSNFLVHDFDIEALCDSPNRSDIPWLRSVIEDYTLWAKCQRDHEAGIKIRLSAPEQVRMGRVISNNKSIYFIYDSERALIKIGMTKDVGRRLRTLRKEFGPHLRVITSFSGPSEMEEYLHGKLRQWRVCGEWFKPSEQLLAFADASADGGLKNVIMLAIKIGDKT